MKFKHIILLGLPLFLTVSPFFLSDYFYHKILIGETRNFAKDKKTHSLVLSAYHEHKLEQKVGSKLWLTSSREIAKVDANVAYELAQYHQEQQQESLAITWYKQAIRLKSIEAKPALAQIFMDNGETRKAFELVKNSQNKKSMVSAVHAALVLGNTDYIIKIFPNLSDFKEGRLLQDLLLKYDVFNELNINQLGLIKPKNNQNMCPLSIQPYATNLADITTFENLITKFTNSNNHSPFCFAQVNYIPKNKLACQYKPNESIQCSPLYFGEHSNQISTRYLAILLPEGGANVNLGIMYIDRNDNEKVFEHELSHLLGFVDEYPLPKSHVKCEIYQQEKFSHNIAVLKHEYQGSQKVIRKEILKNIPWAEFILPTTPILFKNHTEKKVEFWQLGTPEGYEHEIGVFPAKTCTKQSATAFKPLKKTTLLEYFEAPFPTLYKDIVEANPMTFLMPSFHYNVAQSYFEQGNYQQAKVWLHKSAKLEKDTVRMKKMLSGSF